MVDLNGNPVLDDDGQVIMRPAPDGIPDAEDNCPDLYNPDQINADLDFPMKTVVICEEMLAKSFSDKDGDGIPIMRTHASCQTLSMMARAVRASI